MADLIIIKSGAKGSRGAMPALVVGELAYCTDEKVLYRGTNNGNVRLCGFDDAAVANTLLTEISALKTQIADITARLEVLETPSE